MENFGNLLNVINFRDVVDILIVTVLIYYILKLIRNTRAEQVFKGILLILLFIKISQFFQLYTVNWIFARFINDGIVAIIVLFQPEIRRGLQYLGLTSNIKNSFNQNKENVPETVEEIISAVASLARQKIGALIIIENEVGLNEIIETGTEINGNVSSGLLINIFIPNTPLHDGAVVIKGSKIKAAACFLPLSDNQKISKELGTRHRAGIGISERADSLSIMVSEENGTISTAENGVLSRYLDIETLEAKLLEIYSPEYKEKQILKKFGGKNEKDKF
ncbi:MULTISPECIES: diadenylate cyclase CdaA [Peptoniphilus]|uniref:diadenylate cyclase CdaA n=1 Tax=Peptoniphilus TaxID=162289 RepID=UPI00028A234A|nr:MULTISPECIES: diadenylate cyclase CdaA [Peptoniphilus]MBS6610111.1 diadenylate cyclase CdaA [Peptoniphilus harei]MDU1954115.1 diadenylate cyclase CdaA [Peptoniphilus lacydonensis]MDU5376738.1 diadenylate cyclase CdaA [Peptoniphilus lacydonensis]MDU5437223.1 diadenylate cyclase CdaA [Peptoniphilus lacydonensis]MDU7301848.1 diadenylate cyclase CdaA [Peptoniphilus lacydonensis]